MEPGSAHGRGSNVELPTVTAHESAEAFIRRFLDTYESHDLDRTWAFYSADCRFPALERFGVDPTWDNYKAFMTRFRDLTRIGRRFSGCRPTARHARDCGRDRPFGPTLVRVPRH